MRIRHIDLSDAAAYGSLCRRLDGETVFRLYEPGERAERMDIYQEEIQRFLSNSQSTIFIAEEEPGILVGYLQAIGREAKRIRHVISVNVGILQEYTGKGIGGRLFAELESWAGKKGIRRIDLTVMESNIPAQKLYHRLGFVVEGIKRRSMRIGETYVDEIFMSKWLS